jgi:hypothetical protein
MNVKRLVGNRFEKINIEPPSRFHFFKHVPFVASIRIGIKHSINLSLNQLFHWTIDHSLKVSAIIYADNLHTFGFTNEEGGNPCPPLLISGTGFVFEQEARKRRRMARYFMAL